MKDALKMIPRSTAGDAPRGPMMDAAAIARACFDGTVSPKWVRENVPHKIRLGHSTVRWYRDDVLAWLEDLRRAG